MIDYLKDAKLWLAEADATNSATTLHAIALAAIAQAEAAERQAVAMEQIAVMTEPYLERIAYAIEHHGIRC